MITKLYSLIGESLLYVKNHPQILFALTLFIVIPLLFLYSGQQFLDVGKANQDRLQKDRIGLMHDTLSSLLLATLFETSIVSTELSRIAQQNPDIIDYKILKKTGTDIIPVVAKNESELGVKEANTDLYRTASLRTNESVIFEFYDNEARVWASYRAIESADSELYFIYTAVSLKHIDALFKVSERKAYFSLIFVYCFVIVLAYWQIRLTDYRYLYEKAEKASEMKDLFTNMIAHELRTPLTAIIGYANILNGTVIDRTAKVQSERIQDSAERLLSIVNDLLDVARIQSGKLAVTSEMTNISEVIAIVLQELEVVASIKNIKLVHESNEKNIVVLGDKKRLQQALANLVSNAIKYTKEGVITVAVSSSARFAEIRVKDTGMGISAEDQKKLFAPFFRVSNSDVSQITGTGLGMWITKELIELMDGEIAVESIKGVGTQIVVTLPKSTRTM